MRLFSLLLSAGLSLTGAPRAAVPVTTADFSWLVGTWEGRMTGMSATADLTFMAPRAGVMTGTMRLVDTGGKVLVIELIALVDTPSGVEMRFRHFSTDLTAYESEFRQNMRLTAHSVERDDFANAVPYDKALMSTQPRTSSWIRHSADEFVGHSEIIDDSGKPASVEVTYHRRG